MASWERVKVPPNFQGASRAERQGGTYLRYHPDLLSRVPTVLAPEVVEQAADVSTVLALFGGRLRANPLPVLSATALRSESISSSWIEGIRATPRDVAVAQIGAEASSHTAAQVVRNVAAMQDAISLLGAGPWTHDHLWDIQHQLLPWQQRGYRRGQVWLGGSNAFNADYAAPPEGTVHGYVDDLLAHANHSGDLPIVLAAVIHAQFETIHPFEDGNGRIGRALVHGVFKRAGLIDAGVLPLSTALRNDEKGYVAALTNYRYDGDERAAALNAYIPRFLSYVETAAAAAGTFADAAAALHVRWRTAVAGVRGDSALHRAIDVVVENPVVSTGFLSERLGVSLRVAENVISQLREARILTSATGKHRRSPLYQADEILDLLAFGAEAGPRTPAPARLADAGAGAHLTLVHRCVAPTSKGAACQNRVTDVGQKCWRHRS